ncbi:MAG TPA: DUF308 domain-containing protein [Microbacteriaceae bacterium]|nr:DUF308 domain-containing protein [Microbacteriaceae bacterium]
MPIARASVAFVAAVIITFLANHSTQVGLLVFGGYGVAAGVLVGVLALRTSPRGIVRALFVAIGALGLVFGAAALALHGGGLEALIALVSAWAVLTGALELYAGVRSRKRLAAARDWRAVGVLSLALAVAYLIVPPGLHKHFAGQDGVHGTLTAAIVLVGIFGAYAAVVCVYWVIGGLSLRWAAVDEARSGGQQDSRDRKAPDEQPG